MAVVEDVAANAATRGATGVEIVRSAQELAAISHPDCAAAAWERSPPDGFSSWIDSLDDAQLPKVRTILRPEAVLHTVRDLCLRSQMPAGPQREWLIRDIAQLADMFSHVVPAPYLRMRLDVVKTNACRRFHIDAVTARLVCTYRGTGTQFGTSDGGAEPGRIFTVPTCSPIILRGTLWPESPKSGLLHRSPPIEGTGETRLMLVFDPMPGPNEDH